MSAISAIRNNLFFLATAELLSKALGMLLYIFLARYLGPHDFGIYSIAASYMLIFGLFSSFGIDSYLIKEVASHPDKAQLYLNDSILIKIIGGILCYMLVIGCSFLMSYETETIITISIFSITLLYSPVNNTYDSVFRGMQQMHLSALLKICRSVFTLAFIAGMIVLKQDLYSIVSAHVFTAILLNFIFYYFFIRKRICSLSIPLALTQGIDILKGGFPFLITGGIYIVNSKTDVLMLSKLSAPASVGLYDAANGLILVLLIIPSLLSQALYPYLSQQFSIRSGNLASIINFVQWTLAAVSIPIAICLVFLSDQFITLFYGPDYSQSSQVLKIMGLGLPIVFMRSIFGWVLAAIDKVNLMMWTNLMGFVLNIVLNALLIPKYNFIGAALATTISNVFATFVVMAIVKAQVPNSIIFLRFYLNPALPGIFMAIFLWHFSNMNVLISVGCGVGIYIMVYAVILSLQKSEEYRIIRKILNI